jgi:hypothetical protein
MGLSTQASTNNQYECYTQDSLMPTFGVAPMSHHDSTYKGGHSIVVGAGFIVPRWDVTKPLKLLCCVRESSFPNKDHIPIAIKAYKEAAAEWSALDFGLSFDLTTDLAASHYELVWMPDPTEVIPPATEPSKVIARAFFPSEPSNVLVFNRAFASDKNVKALRAILLHELGHIVGLRHEFAITGDPAKGLNAEGGGAKQFMKQNYYSVMSYNFPPTMQQSDKDGVKAFYKLKNGEQVDGFPVTDYLPKVHGK